MSDQNVEIVRRSYEHFAATTDVSAALRIRPASPAEKSALEALQLRSSLTLEEYRTDLEEHPDAIALTQGAIEDSRVRVATIGDEVLGFSEWLAVSDEQWELVGLFVEPFAMRKGVGSRLVSDLSSVARERNVREIGVTAEPRAVAFYERLGFTRGEEVPTRFGPGVRMRLELGGR